MTMPLTSYRAASNRRRAGSLQVVEVARRARVTPATVRYYARIGLLNPQRDERNGYRRFSGDDVRRLRFIRKAQTLGLTIADVRVILDRIDGGGEVCELVVRTVHTRLDQIRNQLAELRSTEARIAAVLQQWTAEEVSAHECNLLCPLIESVRLYQTVQTP
jgi:MerR family transcriptional regulator, Zn(II)-responsive regulator of zntA